jgi:hypothetical protein
MIKENILKIKKVTNKKKTQLQISKVILNFAIA